jgi:hypothetical protein
VQGKLSGHEDPWEELFGARDGRPNEASDRARDLLISALARLPEPPFPDGALQRACRPLRGAPRWGEHPAELLLAASGLDPGTLPEDDLDLWMVLAAGTISPRETLAGHGVSSWRELDDADWLGVGLYLARGGPGTPMSAQDLLAAIVTGPETRGDIDPQHAAEITRAFDIVGRLWRALGAVGPARDGRPLTPLGHWGLPLALLRAWEGR